MRKPLKGSLGLHWKGGGLDPASFRLWEHHLEGTRMLSLGILAAKDCMQVQNLPLVWVYGEGRGVQIIQTACMGNLDRLTYSNFGSMIRFTSDVCMANDGS